MSDRSHQDIRECIETVYRDISQAFADQDIDKALSFFADHEDMTKISNGHVSRGKKELATYWNRRIGNVRNLQVSIENIEMHLIDDQHAWTTAREIISMDGEEQQAIVSNIFLLENSQWKILLDHTTYLD